MSKSHTLTTLVLVIWIMVLAVPLAHGEDLIDSARVERLPQLDTDGTGTGRGIVFHRPGTLRLTVVSAETSSQHDILGLSSPISTVFTSNAAGCVGCSWDAGPFEMGTEIVAYLDNEDLTGPDQVDIYPKIDGISDTLWLLSFEDWSDSDYDDVVCRAELLPDTIAYITSISLDGGITLFLIPPGPIWEGEFDEAGNMISSSPPLPSAAYMKGSLLSSGGSTEMSVTLEGYPELPPAEFGLICQYSFVPQTPGCDPVQGKVAFASWLPTPIRIPQKVGRYSLNLGFDIITITDPQLVKQQYVSGIPFYVTYKEPKIAYPETFDTTFYGRATEWASGKSDELSIVEDVNWGIYTYGANHDWNYIPYKMGWENLILGWQSKGNCVDFSNMWRGMTMLLGVKTETKQHLGSEGKGFVTKTGGISMDNLTGNCGQCPDPQYPDRWRFTMHQIGKYGAGYFDPTLGKEYSSATEYVDWNIIGDSVGIYIDDAGHYIWRCATPDPSDWGLWCYEDAGSASSTRTPLVNAWGRTPIPITDASGDAAFTGVYSDVGTDDNADGYFECLTMTAEVDVSVAGEYTVYGTLYAPDDSIISLRSDFLSSQPLTYATLDCDIGLNDFEIRFSGEDIRRAGVDDSYYAVLHLCGNELDTSATVGTSVYDHTDFREIAAAIVSLVSDQGVDTTDDGLFDYLEAQVSLEVYRAGDFQLRGALEGGTSSAIAEYEHATLTSGTQTLTLKFNGIEVRESEVAGTFDLNLDLRDDVAGCDTKTFTTSSYSYDAFDYRRVRFTDYFNDYGNDTNADGDYEWLTLEAGVETENAGNYIITAFVYDTTGKGGVGADTTVYLDVGVDTVQIDFSGSLLYYLQANGPYSVPYITIEDENGSPKDSREQAYLTSAYTYTDFEPPLLRSVGNYDEYVDPATPPHANLVVTVEVTAAEDGKVTAMADLYTASEVLVEKNVTSAADFTAETAQELSFKFDGLPIWESQEDGPYNVKNLRIWHEADRTQEINVSDAYTTADYDYSDFSSGRSIYGFVTLSGEGLADVFISLFNSSYDLLEEVVTGLDGEYIFHPYDAGDYIVEIAAPLGFEADDDSKNVTVVEGTPSRVDFTLTESGSGYQPQPDEYWLKQCNAYVYGRGKPQESIEDMELYMERVQTHFNNHPENPVTVFTPDEQDDVYEQMRELANLLTVKGQQNLEIRFFRQQFAALLMNLAAEYVNQSMEVNNDGATVSQAVTYCDEILDTYQGDLYPTTTIICENINTGLPVPDGYIPLSTPNILYKQADAGDRRLIPSTYSLSQNYPNPFNPFTEIRLGLPQACNVKLEIFNIMGQRVTTLLDRPLEAGYHKVSWDGTKFASGIYLYRLQAGDFVETKKMLLVK